MIHVERSRLAPPRILKSKQALTAIADARSYFSDPQAHLKQMRYEFNAAIYSATEVRDALDQLFRGKCAYCETRIYSPEEGIVDHFRPCDGLVGLKGPEPSGYWWLAYEWENLYQSCLDCRRAKGWRFPIEGRRAAPGIIGNHLIDEKPLILDPCVDKEPGNELDFDHHGRVVGLSQRGAMTVETLALSRETLVEDRATAILDISTILQSLHLIESSRVLETNLVSVAELLSPEAKHLQPVFQYLQEWAQDTRNARTSGGDEFRKMMQDVERKFRETGVVPSWRGPHSKKAAVFVGGDSSVIAASKENTAVYFGGSRRIERIIIENFRAIEFLDLKFPARSRCRNPGSCCWARTAPAKAPSSRPSRSH